MITREQHLVRRRGEPFKPSFRDFRSSLRAFGMKPPELERPAWEQDRCSVKTPCRFASWQPNGNRGVVVVEKSPWLRARIGSANGSRTH
jgi:hypothetical protein